jgi:hypothetical protein
MDVGGRVVPGTITEEVRSDDISKEPGLDMSNTQTNAVLRQDQIIPMN